MAQQRLSLKIKQNLKSLLETLIQGAAGGGYRPEALASFDLGEQLDSHADGVISSARLKFSVDAANNDTVTLNGHVFKFLTALVTADTFTQVKRGTSLAATQASLINAINGVTDATVVKATTPFTSLVCADLVDATHIRLRQSETQGAVPLAAQAPVSFTLAQSMTQAGDVWNCANMNVSGQAATVGQRQVHGRVTITAAMRTYGSFQIEVPFTVGRLLWDGYTSAGIKRAIDEAVTFSGNVITVTTAGGSAPNWQANDVFDFIAAE